MTTFCPDLVLGPTASPDKAPLHRQEVLTPVYLFNSASKIDAFNAFLIAVFILP